MSLYTATVPVLKQMLLALSDVLKKGEEQAQQRKFDPVSLLQSRLFPDMLPLVRQVQIACDFAKSVPLRIAGLEVAAYEDTEQSFAELQQRISKTLDSLAIFLQRNLTLAQSKRLFYAQVRQKKKNFLSKTML